MRDVKTEDGWINPGYSFAMGANELDGKQALVFIRELNHLKDGYETRWQNFREVYTGLLTRLNEVFSEIKKPVNSLTDVKEIYDDREEEISVFSSLIDKLEGSIATDIDTRGLMNFALSELLHASEWKLTTVHPAAEYELHPIYSAEYYEMQAGVISAEDLQAVQNAIREILGN